MTNHSLARSYLQKAPVRLKVLQLLFDEGAFSDVIRKARETVELALKGMLRHIGIEPPKWHDVCNILIEHRQRLPRDAEPHVERLKNISGWLRKEREFSLYGDIDFIPTEEYNEADARRAIDDVQCVVSMAAVVIPARDK